MNRIHRLGLALITLLVAAPMVARAISPPKATGEVWYTDGMYQVRVDFAAHQPYGIHPVRGDIRYEEDDGSGLLRYYDAEVTCAVIDFATGEATFSALITSTNVLEWENKWVQFWVTDVGSSGSQGDTIVSSFFEQDPACGAQHPGSTNLVEQGNLVIHPVIYEGDLNCDGRFDGADIDLFFLALGDPDTYQVTFPECSLLLADMNCDGLVNGADIDPFFECIGGAGRRCECP